MRGVLPPEELIEWLFALVPWMASSLRIPARRGTVVLPLDEEFPVDTSLSGQALAEDFLAFVVEHAGLGGRAFTVRMDEERGPAAALKGMVHAMTPSITGGTSVPVARGKPLPIPISAPELTDRRRLIAVLARGLAHYHSQTARTPIPEPSSMQGAVVDVITVFLGFGVFLANACHDAGGFERGGLIGFRVQRLGELGPIEVAYALALRARLVGADPEEITPHLRANPRAFFQAAWRDLGTRDLDALDVAASAYRS